MEKLKEILERVSYRPKLAFALHTREVYTHYAEILKSLSPTEYDLILIDADTELKAFVAELPCTSYELPQLLNSTCQGYRYLVSHHFHGMMKLQLSDDPAESIYYPLIKFLGQYNIRLMYGLGHDHWNFADWNAYYDLHLCFGPWQAEKLARFDSLKLEVGVPRYSGYFQAAQDPLRRDKLREDLGLQPNDRVLIWLPTLGAENTLPIYLQQFCALADECVLRIKPHPLSWQQEPEKLVGLADVPPEWVIRHPVDNLDLFLVADYLLCDYGGVAFSGIYTDQNLLLLDHPDKKLLPEESDALIRQTLGSFSPANSQALRNCLNDTAFWKVQAAQRASLRKQFFTPYGPESARMAAKILKHLSDYLP